MQAINKLIYKGNNPSIVHYLPEIVIDFYERNGDVAFILILNMLMSYFILFKMEKNIWNETKYLFIFIQFRIILFFNFR